MADAYATYCMAIGLEASIDFLSSRPDLQGYLIYSEGENMKTVVVNELTDKHLFFYNDNNHNSPAKN